MDKIKELAAEIKSNNFLDKDARAKKIALWAFAIIGGIALIAAAAYAVYRIFAPDYLEDYDDINDGNSEEETQA